jgi:trimeric autotransporter adhesin
MAISWRRLAASVASLGVIALYGCGGGGGSGSTGGGVALATAVPITVVDGPIQNAVVCLDKNKNGVCDTGEPFAKTDAAGKANLSMDTADVGKYPVLAVVGTDAIDTDTGAVPTPFTMSAPADQPAVITPLTTLVQEVVASTGVSSAAAETQVRAQTGINVSLFSDFSKSSTQENKEAATLARMAVVATQRQVATLGNGVVGMPATDGTTITQADVNKAVRSKIMELLPDLIKAANDPAVQAAANAAAKEAALLAAANTLMTSSGLTPAVMPVVVAINTQTASTAAVAAPTPAAGFNITSLRFTDATNFFTRFFTGSLAQNTPDAGGNYKYVERRYQSTAGVVTQWGKGGTPRRGSDLHWNGSNWVNCPINFENTNSARDAQGNSTYNYCDSYSTGKSNRATFDVTGKSMATVFGELRAAGYTNLSIGDNTTSALTAALGTATFPANSELRYQTGTPLTNAIAYYPGVGNQVNQYSAVLAAGGTAGGANACQSSETNTSGTPSTSLETMMAVMTGTPCIYGPGSFVYPASNGTTYTGDLIDEAWYQSTVHIGTIGTVLLGNSTPAPASAPGFYSGNTRLRVAFKGTGANATTYYACKERFNNGSPRNCVVIGTGTYTINTLGDARTLVLNNLPAQTAPLNYTQVFVERGGKVYWGYQDKPIGDKTARFNAAGTTALLNKLGLVAAVPNPSTAMALTNASFEGSYKGAFTGTYAGTFATTLSTAGVSTCSGVQTSTTPNVTFTCNFTVTGVTGTKAAISFGTVSSGATFAGELDFYTGEVSGNWTNTGAAGTFAGARQ